MRREITKLNDEPVSGAAGDICPHLNVQPCAKISSTRPRTCTACIGKILGIKIIDPK